MEKIDNNDQTDISVILTSDEMKSYLLEASKWGKFLAIMGYIGIGFIILVAILMTIGLSFAGNAMAGTGFPMGLVGILYLLLAVVYYFPVSYLYKFSKDIKIAILSNNTFSLTSGFGNLKSLFKFMGILTIVMISLYVLAIIIAIPAAIMFAQ